MTPPACRCRMVPCSLWCRPRTATLAPSSSGSSAAVAAQLPGPLVQAEARGGVAGGGTQVQPADLVLRVRAQVEHARQRRGAGNPGAEAEGVAGALVIGRGEAEGDGQARTPPRSVRFRRVS